MTVKTETDASPRAIMAPSMPAESPILCFDQVSKWYGPVIGVNQVTLELRGGITGLVGANGAGKSTMLRLATGQLRPDVGRVTVRGIDAWDWPAKRLIGYSPDHDVFYEEMSGFQFVEAMARLFGYDRHEARLRTEAVLERVGMAGRSDRRLRGYSKGMRQRIKLAQALLHDPELLILDEPLSGIDPVGRYELVELFRSLAQAGKCLLISSHELEELEKLTDHVAIMARGRIAAVGTVVQIRDLLDDQPISVLVETPDPRAVASLLLPWPEVVGLDFGPGIDGGESLLIRARNPRPFFRRFGRLVIEEGLEIHRLEALDDSTQAILSYLLGGGTPASSFSARR
ncbi:MAG: ABC transporter ATP-binding protein [Gemmataceae bacterium]|nr:ABC transporter ATP-binding protein [Gemmataceae bacterium]